MPQNLTSVNGNLHVYFSYLVGNLHTINNLNAHTHTHNIASKNLNIYYFKKLISPVSWASRH